MKINYFRHIKATFAFLGNDFVDNTQIIQCKLEPTHTYPVMYSLLSITQSGCEKS